MSARVLLLSVLLLSCIAPGLCQSVSWSFYNTSTTCVGTAAGTASVSTTLSGGNYTTPCTVGGNNANFSYFVLCDASSSAYYINAFNDQTCTLTNFTYASTSGGCDTLGNVNGTVSLAVTCSNPSSGGALTAAAVSYGYAPLVALLLLVASMTL